MALPSIVAGQSAEWTRFRANASGIAESGAAPRPSLDYRSACSGSDPPVTTLLRQVWNGRVYLIAFAPEAKKLELIRVSAKTGEILWQQTRLQPGLKNPRGEQSRHGNTRIG